VIIFINPTNGKIEEFALLYISLKTFFQNQND